MVSSGIFAYHCNMNWANHKYVQKIEKANMYFPKSWMCSLFTNSSWPRFLKYITKSVIRAIPDTNELPKVYQLYMVLYQCASILMSHSHGMREPMVTTKKTT